MPEHRRWFTPYDWSRSYVLPDTVSCNIPRRHRTGDYGAWNAARGVLVEICLALDATPLSLHYQELEVQRTRAPIGNRITAHAQRRDGREVWAVYRRETAPYGPRGDFWSVAINGVIPDDGIDTHPPSLPWLGYLVRRTLRADTSDTA